MVQHSTLSWLPISCQDSHNAVSHHTVPLSVEMKTHSSTAIHTNLLVVELSEFILGLFQLPGNIVMIRLHLCQLTNTTTASTPELTD